MVAISRRIVLTGSLGLVASLSQLRTSFAQDNSVRIGVGSDPAYAPFFVASHEGLFEAEGVSADIQFYTGGADALNAVIAQQVDVASAGEPTTMTRLARAPLRPLAVVYQSTSFHKMVVRSGIDSPQQVKRFGVVPGSVSEYSARRAILHFGLDLNSIELVPLAPPELPALLSRGDIDAFFAWEPWPSMAVDGGATIVATNSDVGYIDTQWLTASEDAFLSKPAALQGVLRALARACEIVRDEPERAAAAVFAVAKIPKETSLKAFLDMNSIVRDFTEEDLSSFDQIAEFLVENKVTDTSVPYRDYLQFGFYKG